MADNSPETSRTSGLTQTGPLTPEVVSREPISGGYVFANAGHEHHEEAERPLLSYLGAIMAKKWVIVCTVILSLGASALYLRFATPVYVSKATIEVEKLHPPSSNAQDMFLYFGQSQLHFQTQVEALKSGNVPDTYFRRPNATSPGQASPAPGPADESSQQSQVTKPAASYPPAQGYRSFGGRIKVNPVEGTQLIRVEMTASDPVVARQDLQDYLEAFIAYNRGRQMEITGRLKAWLKQELEDSQKQFDKAQKEYLDFANRHGVIIGREVPSQSFAFHERAADNYYASKEKRIQAEALQHEREGVLPKNMSKEFLQNLKNELAKLQAEQESMRTIYDPDYYKMKVMESKIVGLQRTIAELEESEVGAAVEIAKKREDLAGQSYEHARQEALKMAPLAVQFEMLRRGMESTRDLHLRLQERFKHAEMEHVTRGLDIILSSPPTLPVDPVSPNRSKAFVTGSLIGLLSGVILVIILDASDRTVRNAADVERRLRVPILGVVPRLSRSERPRKGAGDAFTVEFMPFRSPVSPFADAIRMVEHTISGHLPDETGGVLCISSSMPLEGKTFISVSMAAAIASEQKRVLIIDADMRRPRIHKLFRKESPGEGLSDLLSDTERDLKSTIVRSRIPGLYYLTAGEIPENPVALLKTKRLRDIVAACRKAFDYVIIDSPPMLGLADAAIIAEHADGLILVIHHGHTPVDAVQRTHEIATKSKGRMLGVVLNMAEARIGDYDYYRYRYYNRYYHKKTA
jgi:polysaccharide biosynthesis transport protein